MIKILIILVSTCTISNSVIFAFAKATHIFYSKNIGLYAIFNDQSFNDTLTNDIVIFEQLGPGQLITFPIYHNPFMPGGLFCSSLRTGLFSV